MSMCGCWLAYFWGWIFMMLPLGRSGNDLLFWAGGVEYVGRRSRESWCCVLLVVWSMTVVVVDVLRCLGLAVEGADAVLLLISLWITFWDVVFVVWVFFRLGDLQVRLEGSSDICGKRMSENDSSESMHNACAVVGNGETILLHANPAKVREHWSKRKWYDVCGRIIYEGFLWRCR